MTTDRLPRAHVNPDAFHELRHHAGRQFDPNVTAAPVSRLYQGAHRPAAARRGERVSRAALCVKRHTFPRSAANQCPAPPSTGARRAPAAQSGARYSLPPSTPRSGGRGHRATSPSFPAAPPIASSWSAPASAASRARCPFRPCRHRGRDRRRALSIRPRLGRRGGVVGVAARCLRLPPRPDLTRALQRWATSYGTSRSWPGTKSPGVVMRRSNFYFRTRRGPRAAQDEGARGESPRLRSRPGLADANGISPDYGVVDAYAHMAPMIDTDQYMGWLSRRSRPTAWRSSSSESRDG